MTGQPRKEILGPVYFLVLCPQHARVLADRFLSQGHCGQGAAQFVQKRLSMAMGREETASVSSART